MIPYYFLSNSKNIKDKWQDPYRDEHCCTMEVQFKTAALLEVAFFLVKSKYTRANAQHQEYITKNSPMEVNFSFSLITIPSPTT